MTAAHPPAPNEPPPPQRGMTREERGRDVSAAEAEAEAETSTVQKYLKVASPRYLFSMAEGYPVVLKQFIQFCLILIYPAWIFFIVVAAAMQALFYVTVYPVLWLLFWPMRAHQKKNHPEEYAESQEEEVAARWDSSTARRAARVTVAPAVVRPRQQVTATVRDRQADRQGQIGPAGMGLRQLLPLPLGRAGRLRGRRGQ